MATSGKTLSISDASVIVIENSFHVSETRKSNAGHTIYKVEFTVIIIIRVWVWLFRVQFTQSIILATISDKCYCVWYVVLGHYCQISLYHTICFSLYRITALSGLYTDLIIFWIWSKNSGPDINGCVDFPLFWDGSCRYWCWCKLFFFLCFKWHWGIYGSIIKFRSPSKPRGMGSC